MTWYISFLSIKCGRRRYMWSGAKCGVLEFFTEKTVFTTKLDNITIFAFLKGEKDSSFYTLALHIAVLEVFLVLLLLPLNIFHTLFWCFRFWLWRSKCQLGICFLFYMQKLHIKTLKAEVCTPVKKLRIVWQPNFRKCSGIPLNDIGFTYLYFFNWDWRKFFKYLLPF